VKGRKHVLFLLQQKELFLIVGPHSVSVCSYHFVFKKKHCFKNWNWIHTLPEVKWGGRCLFWQVYYVTEFFYLALKCFGYEKYYEPHTELNKSANA
jgi:hypothetical protein